MSFKSLYQDVKQWNAKLKAKKNEPVALPEIDHTHHVCQHCGYGYDGRHCPQCGLHAEQVRFTFKRLIHNFLDIWGMGNRPMFRSMRDLFWRPGYMIRDYLGGHHLSYFPPFKMLAVLTIFIFLLALTLRLKPFDFSEHWGSIINSIYDKGMRRSTKLFSYLDNNDLSRIMVQNVFVVLAAWITFRKKGFNLVETFFAQIYINCQMHMITIVWILLTLNLPPSYWLPYSLPTGLAVLILIYDYKQLYNLKLVSAIGRTLLFVIMVAVMYVIFLLLLLFIVLVIAYLSGDSATIIQHIDNFDPTKLV